MKWEVMEGTDCETRCWRTEPGRDAGRKERPRRVMPPCPGDTIRSVLVLRVTLGRSSTFRRGRKFPLNVFSAETHADQMKRIHDGTAKRTVRSFWLKRKYAKPEHTRRTRKAKTEPSPPKSAKLMFSSQR